MRSRLTVIIFTFCIIFNPAIVTSEEPTTEPALAKWAGVNEERIGANMQEAGLKPEIVKKLLMKLKNGQRLDSMKQTRCLNLKDFKDGTGEIIKELPDGSIIKVAAISEKTQSETTYNMKTINPKVMSSICGKGYCTYTNYFESMDLITTGKFYAKYTIYNNGYDKINSV